jgi:hypothetical protein
LLVTSLTIPCPTNAAGVVPTVVTTVGGATVASSLGSLDGKGTRVNSNDSNNSTPGGLLSPVVTHEQFFSFLEQEMRKIESFTISQVLQIRKVLNEVERTVTFAGMLTSATPFSSSTNTDKNGRGGSVENVEELQSKVEKAGDDFLK